MPRPCKSRRVCALPGCVQFGPKNDPYAEPDTIIMTLDEYETIRLIDLEEMTQEQCATQMDIARTTAQAIYNSARKKLARCLFEQNELLIEGGSYTLCDGNQESCGCRRRCRHHIQEDHIMRIGVTYENGQIFQHFGHTETFKVYEVEDGKVVSSKVVDTNGQGHGALAGVLNDLQVDTLICGGIGGGAQNALANAGIKLYGGVSGDADAAVEALLKNTLAYNPDVKCNHHDHEHGEGHTCGSHGCGNH